MWSPGVYAEEQTDLADSPSRYNLTVKDLLLSSSSGDLVSSPHLPPGASEHLQVCVGYLVPLKNSTHSPWVC